MLFNLRESIEKEQKFGAMTSSVMEAIDSDDIRDAFLSDIESADLELEGDPELEKIIGKIPATDDDKISDDDIEEIVENYIPENI